MSSFPSHCLDEISLTGYKSIRELKEFKMSPGLNVLIGANGSGKTNFIRFFELLGHMFDTNKGLQNYVATRGRADAFLFRERNPRSDVDHGQPPPDTEKAGHFRAPLFGKRTLEGFRSLRRRSVTRFSCCHSSSDRSRSQR